MEPRINKVIEAINADVRLQCLRNTFHIVAGGCHSVQQLYIRIHGLIEGEEGMLTCREVWGEDPYRIVNHVAEAYKIEGYSKQCLDRVYLSFAGLMYPLLLNETGISSVKVDMKGNSEKKKVLKSCDNILVNSTLSSSEHLMLEGIKDRHKHEKLDTFREFWLTYAIRQGTGPFLKGAEDTFKNAIITKSSKTQNVYRHMLLSYWYNTLNQDGATEIQIAEIYNTFLERVPVKKLTVKDINYSRQFCPSHH